MGHSFRGLIAWQKALAVHVYRETESFPKAETYGLRSQVRRAAISVVSNIAEGQGRTTTGEFQQFLGHSRGSLLELETQLEIACELGMLDRRIYETLAQESYQVLGLINRLIESVRRVRKRP
jgi:four helix bundle protein